jgi:hypothetical protein
MNPRPSPMLPAPNYPETDRNVMRHPLSRSSPSSHYKSDSNNFPFQGGPPPGTAHHSSSGHVAQSNTLGLSLSNPSTVPLAYRSHSKGGNPYDSRISRHSDMEKMPIREYSESQIAGSSTMDRSMQDNSVPSSSVARYECSYCGKGFNRPSSLKVRLPAFPSSPFSELRTESRVIRYTSTVTREKNVSNIASINHMSLMLCGAAFTCTFEGCGRSFSVLSNMRRHARVHTSAPDHFREGSSDEESDEP